MTIDKNELELLSAGYLAATQNNQDKLRVIVTTMSDKFDHWFAILQTGAMLSLESIDLTHEKVREEPIKEIMSSIGLQGHESTYSLLYTALVILRGNPLEISCLESPSKNGMITAMLTVIGQSIFKKCGYQFSVYEDTAKEAAANTLEILSNNSQKDKKKYSECGA